MNPFNLTGPDFLIFHALLFLIALLGGAFLRWQLREPCDEPTEEQLILDPYEIAYLGGGEQLAVHAAIATLVQRDLLERPAGGKLSANGRALPADAHPLEIAVHTGAMGLPNRTIKEVRERAAAALRPIRARLEELGLLVAAGQGWLARLVPLLLVLGVVLVGVIKLQVGLSRNKPVNLLIAACILSVIVALLSFARAVHRSRRGDQALARFKEENAALCHTARHRPEALAGADFTLAVGLFGMAVLAGGPLGYLPNALLPPAHTGGEGGGGGCSGGGCSGGGCGG